MAVKAERAENLGTTKNTELAAPPPLAFTEEREKIIVSTLTVLIAAPLISTDTICSSCAARLHQGERDLCELLE